MSEAETPLVTVAGVNRPIHKGEWYQAMEEEMQGLIESKAIAVVDELPNGKRAVEMDAVLQV